MIIMIDLFHPNYADQKISMEEVFATNFNVGGGHFLFCDNIEDSFVTGNLLKDLFFSWNSDQPHISKFLKWIF